MTPQLQQSIRLLQLSRLDLVETVRKELMENPFLEESVDQPTMDEKRQQAEPERKPDHDQENVYDRESSRNEDWEDYLGDFASSRVISSSARFRKRRACRPKCAIRASPLCPDIFSGSFISRT